jgi:hypothetical protein
MLIYGRGKTGLNAVQERFARSSEMPHSRLVARAYFEGLQHLSERLQQQFPGGNNRRNTHG